MKTKLPDKKILAAVIIAVLLLSAVPPAFASNWSKPRPSTDITYDQRIENAYTDGEASVGLGVHIWEYQEDFYPGVDALKLRVVATANARRGITYDVGKTGDDCWYDATEETGINDDDSGTWLDLPFDVWFYGGPGTTYDRVWVCSNGFLSFDCESRSYSPKAFLTPISLTPFSRRSGGI